GVRIPQPGPSCMGAFQSTLAPEKCYFGLTYTSRAFLQEPCSSEMPRQVYVSLKLDHPAWGHSNLPSHQNNAILVLHTLREPFCRSPAHPKCLARCMYPSNWTILRGGIPIYPRTRIMLFWS